jgi:hypothetical protein
MKRHIKGTPFRVCAIAAFLTGLYSAAWADERPLSAEQQAEQARVEAVSAISANRDGAIADLVSQWSSAATALGYNSVAWKSDFTAALQRASDAQLYDIKSASSYAGVTAILQGRSAPASVEGVVGADALGDTYADLLYTPVTPCRVLDTRFGTGVYAGPIPAGGIRSYYVHGTAAGLAPQGHTAGTGCSSPKGEPVAMAANFTVVPTTSGHIRVYPYFALLPTASFLNFQPGANLANAGIIATCYNCGYDLSVYNNVSVNYLADVMGYFYPADSVGSMIETAQGGYDYYDEIITTSSYPGDFVGYTSGSSTLTVLAGDEVIWHASTNVWSNTGLTDQVAGTLTACYRNTSTLVVTELSSFANETDFVSDSTGITQQRSFQISGRVASMPAGTYEFGFCATKSNSFYQGSDDFYVGGTKINVTRYRR